MSKLCVKHPNKLLDLINIIENNELDKAKLLLELNPRILEKKSIFKEEHPILFSIRLKSNKMFNLLIEHEKDYIDKKYLPFLLRTIIEKGTEKMLIKFTDIYHINLSDEVYESYKELIGKNKENFGTFYNKLFDNNNNNNNNNELIVDDISNIENINNNDEFFSKNEQDGNKCNSPESNFFRQDMNNFNADDDNIDNNNIDNIDIGDKMDIDDFH